MLQQTRKADRPDELALTQATIRADSVRRDAAKVDTAKIATSIKENQTNYISPGGATNFVGPIDYGCNADTTAAWDRYKRIELPQYSPGQAPGGMWDLPMNASKVSSATAVDEAQRQVDASSATGSLLSSAPQRVELPAPLSQGQVACLDAGETGGDGSITKTEFCANWGCSLSGRPMLAVVMAICLQIVW